MPSRPMPHALIDADDSILIVIDVQAAFLDKLPARDRGQLVERICWLMKVAQWRRIPLVVTVEELSQQPVAPQVVDSLPTGAPIFDKASFDLAGQPDILLAVEAMNRKTAALVGLETDVCIAQSALGLLERGYRVAVVADATGTPAPGHEIGLQRAQAAGVILVSTKSLFYEWMRTIEMTNRFHRECPGMHNLDGIVL